jgi:hypothetical protein
MRNTLNAIEENKFICTCIYLSGVTTTLYVNRTKLFRLSQKHVFSLNDGPNLDSNFLKKIQEFVISECHVIST